jgi:GTP cyclohydrolase I
MSNSDYSWVTPEIARSLSTLAGSASYKTFPKNDNEEVEAAEVLLRVAAGLKMDNHGKETPRRFVNMLKELTTPQDIKWKTFPADGADQMVVVRNIPFVSLCNHHVVPFVGKADIGYIPDELIVGLSKFARVVKHFASGLQIQERLTQQVADFITSHLLPKGVAVVMEAEHLCMTIRGVQAPGTRTYTAVMNGVFNDHTRTAKAEFLSRLNGGH